MGSIYFISPVAYGMNPVGRIKELEHWKMTRLSTSWPSCTSVGGINFLAADSVSQDILAGGENEDNTSFNGGDDNRRRQCK